MNQDEIMNKSKKSPQYLRTDRAIVDAFCRLLEQHSYEYITIQQLLEETPISRAAFYQHFMDKEAIGEQLLTDYHQLQKTIVTSLSSLPQSQYNARIQEISASYLPYVNALRKIHTNKVNLSETIAQELRNRYVTESNSPYKEIEADIYAKALTEFQLSTFNGSVNDYGNPSIYNHIMIEVFLKLMNWDKNQHIRKTMHDFCPKD